ncbi:MAG TPA: histidine kinase, partial [Pseudomonadales bacterium]|nr:histidine kinase [Pseudomonadales bacterium]
MRITIHNGGMSRRGYVHLQWVRTTIVCIVLLLGKSILAQEHLPEIITNVLQFQRYVNLLAQTNCPVRLEGTICWADMSQGLIILQNSSGTALIEVPPQDQILKPGQEISLLGIYGGSQGGAEFKIGSLVLVDNCEDGMRERSDAILLNAGEYPISAYWFDGGHLLGVDFFYEGPDLPRQSIPDSKLFHAVRGADDSSTNRAPGLEYSAYEGQWSQMPDFTSLIPVERGIARNFDPGMKSRETGIGLQFNGYLEVQEPGTYRFTIVPQGRRQLFISKPHIETTDVIRAPKLLQINAGQIASDAVQSSWAEVEGVVAYVSREPARGLGLELSSDAGNMRVQIGSTSGGSTGLLLGSRVRITGICQSTYMTEGQRIYGKMWTPNLGQVKLLEVNQELWSSHPEISIGSLDSMEFTNTIEPIIHVTGKVYLGKTNSIVIVKDETGSIALEIEQEMSFKAGDSVEALGQWNRSEANPFLKNAFLRKVEQTNEPPNPMPILTTAEQVKRLNREEALRQYPVRIRGVVTWSGGSGFVIQDATLGVFAEMVNPGNFGAQRDGECLDIEGVTTAQFSPMILVQHITDLGPGSLPEPARPTWDQLMDGTLDTQYAEIQGIVTALEGTRLTLLTHDGRLQIILPEMQHEQLEAYVDALIRIRGCLWAVKHEATHVLMPGEIEIHDASISIDQPAPHDPFTAPFKHVSELLLFDAKAGALQRVKVIGQIVHADNGEYYLMDGINGLRFTLRTSAPLNVGDQVEVVGFPLLGGPSPVLREAVVRPIGHYDLQAPRQLPEDSILNGSYDSTLVKVRAQLMNISEDQNDYVLGLRAGSSMFIARFNKNLGALSLPPVGSRLELTGVYAGQGGGRIAGRDIDSFELLLNTPADIRVLARPSWWTIKRVFAVIGVLLGILTVASVWIGLLRRQVEQRTEQLKKEIIVRQRAEQQRAVEEERSRIARDLHDDLGSGLTEISMLADAGAGSPPVLEKANQRFHNIGSKARAVVHAMDVIVWLVNPSKDVLPFLVGYIGSYAEEYLTAAGITCRLKVPSEIPSLNVTAQIRHNLFLAVKEALHNIVRHSQASEATIEMAIKEKLLMVTISDNGRGLDTT